MLKAIPAAQNASYLFLWLCDQRHIYSDAFCLLGLPPIMFYGSKHNYSK